MLIALLIAASAIGPVVAGLIPHAVGPLSILRFLFTNIQPVDPQTLQNLCSDPAQAKDCAVAQLQLRAGVGGIFMAILPSFLLLLLADGLRRGRRFAWVGTLLIQVGLSVLAGITITAALQAAPPNTGTSEGITAIEGSASSQPLTLALPLLMPLALTIALLATVTSWLPVYRQGHIVGWTLDFMRRRSNGFRAASNSSSPPRPSASRMKDAISSASPEHPSHGSPRTRICHRRRQEPGHPAALTGCSTGWGRRWNRCTGSGPSWPSKQNPAPVRTPLHAVPRRRVPGRHRNRHHQGLPAHPQPRSRADPGPPDPPPASTGEILADFTLRRKQKL
ncbi:uncharacterized protein Cgl0966/cg1103 [Arthrobacter sp. Hiyo1]|nr:uncharacterized protein Cgl0966/cg1103 [Arthrobacter sp. Hiyo1]